MYTHATPVPDPIPAILVIILGLAVWFDVGERRIPNGITIGGTLTVLVIRAAMGPDALLTGLAGGGVGLALGLLFFAAGVMGAGDGKLLTAVGTCLGLELFLWCLPLVGAFGGLLVVVTTLVDGTLVATLLRFRALLFHVVTFGRIGESRTLTTPGAVTVPYGVAVAAGAVTAWLAWGIGS